MEMKFGRIQPKQWLKFFDEHGINQTGEVIEETAGFLISVLVRALKDSALEGPVVIGETSAFRFTITPIENQPEEAKWH